MPIITGIPKPPEDHRRLVQTVEPADVFRVKGDYRFTGYKLPVDENGQIIVDWPKVSQPAFWSYRSTPLVFRGTLA